MERHTSQRASLHPLRMQLVYLSTASMLATILVFPLIFIFDPPLEFADFLRVLQQIFPIFVGFLVSAIGFAFGERRDITLERDRYDIIQFILRCSFSIYWIGFATILGLYLWSHSRYAPLGEGMSKDNLFALLTLLVSGITGMVGLISTKLFLEEGKGSIRAREPRNIGEAL